MANAVTSEFRLKAAQLRAQVNWLMELTWLAGLALVPIVFTGDTWFANFTEPKQNVAHITALILLCLWLADAALRLVVYESKDKLLADIRGWFRRAWRNPYKVALIFAALYVFGNIITLLASPLPILSFIGRNVNEPGNDFYTTMSYVLIFLTVAANIKSRAQLERVLWVNALAGFTVLLYGLSQLAGIDPFGSVATLERIGSTFGNALFFSAYVLLSAFAAFTLAILNWSRGGDARRLIALLLLAGIVIAFTVIISTESRGPFVAIVGACTFAIFAALFITRGLFYRLRLLIVAGLFAATWFTGWYAAGNLSSPLFWSAYLFGAAGIVVLFFFEWFATRNTRLALICLPLTLGAQALIVFWLGGAGPSTIVSSVLGSFLLIPIALYLVLNHPLDLSFSSELSALPAKTARPVRSRRVALRRERTANRFSFDALKPILNYRDTRAFLIVAVGLSLIIPYLALFGDSNFGRIGQDIQNADVDPSTFFAGAPVGDDGNPTQKPTAFFPTVEVSADSAYTTVGDISIRTQNRGTLFNTLNDLSTRRLNIWRGSVEIATSRVSVFDEGGFTRFIRHVWGSGHDLYAVQYPLTLDPQDAIRPSLHPHNFILQVWVEQGLWGLIAYLGLLAAILWAAARVIFRRAKSAADYAWFALASIGLSSIFVVHALDQSVSVTRISDAFAFWAICGVLLALYRLRVSPEAKDEGPPAPVKLNGKQVARRRRRAASGGFMGAGWRSWTPIGLFSAAFIAGMALFIAFDTTGLYHSARVISSQTTEAQISNITAAVSSRPENSSNLINYITVSTAPLSAAATRDEQVRLLKESVDVYKRHIDAASYTIEVALALTTAYQNLFILREDEYLDAYREQLAFVSSYFYNFPLQMNSHAAQQLLLADYEATRIGGDPEQARQDYENALLYARMALAAANYQGLYRDSMYRVQAAASRFLGMNEQWIEALRQATLLTAGHINRGDAGQVTSSTTNDLTDLASALNQVGRAAEANLILDALALNAASEVELFNIGDEGSAWAIDQARARVFSLLNESDDLIITTLTNYASDRDRLYRNATYDRYTVLLFEFLSEYSQTRGDAPEITACYNSNVDALNSFFEQGGYDNISILPPELECPA